VGEPIEPAVWRWYYDLVGKGGAVIVDTWWLIHRVVEAQEPRREPSDVELMADIARAEYAGCEADERGQHDEDVVEIIHQEIRGRLGTAEEQRDRGEESQESRDYIELRRQPVS